jgi:hypothetical protein
MKNKILNEIIKREDEILTKFKNILKNKRLIINDYIDLNSFNIYRCRFPIVREKP